MGYSIRIAGGLFIAVVASFVLACYMKRTYDIGAVVGKFNAVFPCGDCPGIDTSLTLNADGTYELVSDYQDRNSTFTTNGHWTVSWSAPVVELSGAKERFYILNKNTLELLNHDGDRIKSHFDYTLKRQH